MSNVRTQIIVPIVLLLVLLGGVHSAFASEISGTLSSDGSNDTQGNIMRETTATPNSGQLEGIVVDGRDEVAGLGFLNPSSWNTSTWIISFSSIVGLVALGYFFWYRRIA